jgi:hypothetical protein
VCASGFFFQHSEFDIYYHYFCRLHNSSALPFESAARTRAIYARPSARPWVTHNINGRVLPRNSYTQYLLLDVREIAQQRGNVNNVVIYARVRSGRMAHCCSPISTI